MKCKSNKYPLSHPQQRIWYEEKLNNTLGYNILLPLLTINESIDFSIAV